MEPVVFPPDNGEKARATRRKWIKPCLGTLFVVLYIAGFFWMAGRLDWVRGWAFMGLLVCGQTVQTLYLWRRSPELVRRRARIGANTKKWDKAWLAGFAILYVVIAYVGALDNGRHGWSRMPAWLWPAGAALYLIFLVFVHWAMVANPHFEKSVRIQNDRNHKVVDTGPYRIVRHPGYIGSIFGFILTPPLLLGSWWAMVPAGVTCLWLVFRTVLEDRTLRRELDGYEDYARRVRYRLIPFVW